MNLQEHINNIRRIVETKTQAAIGSVIIPAGTEMVGNIINRNANRGENTDGSKRSGYSKKPIYAGKKQFVKSGFSPKGKFGDANFDNGKPHETMFLPGGYEQLRQIQGRRTDIKNYDYSGDTLLAFGLEATNDGANIGFRTKKSSEIRQGLESRNGAAFPPSEGEKEQYKKQVVERLTELQVNALKGIE